MFVKLLDSPYRGLPIEIGLRSIEEVSFSHGATVILTSRGKEYSSKHPPEMVRKALKLYAGFLSGREKTAIPFPTFPRSNDLCELQGISGLCLDLTGEKITITEETAPADTEGNTQLDATQTRILRTLSYAKDAAHKAAEEEARKNPQIGQTVAGKGVYVGVWAPKDRDGKSLGKTFAVYAAPEDLTDASGKKLVATFKDAARELASKRNWHGADGGEYASDTALYKGLADGSAISKWFLPTRDLLVGTDIDGKKVQDDSLYAHKDKSDLKGTFTTSRDGCGGYDYPNYYWSLSEHRDDRSDVWCARLAAGGGVWNTKDGHRLSSRPCRVEALSL
jgi:hypothetical protein